MTLVRKQACCRLAWAVRQRRRACCRLPWAVESRTGQPCATCKCPCPCRPWPNQMCLSFSGGLKPSPNYQPGPQFPGTPDVGPVTTGDPLYFGARWYYSVTDYSYYPSTSGGRGAGRAISVDCVNSGDLGLPGPPRQVFSLFAVYSDTTNYNGNYIYSSTSSAKAVLEIPDCVAARSQTAWDVPATDCTQSVYSASGGSSSYPYLAHETAGTFHIRLGPCPAYGPTPAPDDGSAAQTADPPQLADWSP